MKNKKEFLIRKQEAELEARREGWKIKVLTKRWNFIKNILLMFGFLSMFLWIIVFFIGFFMAQGESNIIDFSGKTLIITINHTFNITDDFKNSIIDIVNKIKNNETNGTR